MKIGIFCTTTDFGMRPDDVAVACEERGFESLWVPEHTHIPASRRTPPPGGGELPKDYYHLHDPFLSLAAAAARTSTIKLGTGICLVVERDPIILAKEIATLDVLSEGRVLFGIGGGWNVEEMENHGTPFDRRWKVLRERVEAMKAIWTEDEPEYRGEFVNFDPIWLYPKPVQKPHPPIIMGSNTVHGRRRTIRYCDGWMPTAFPPEQMADAMADLRAQAQAAGRDPASIPVTGFWARPKPEVLAQYQELGVDRVIFATPGAQADELLPVLDRFAPLIEQFA